MSHSDDQGLVLPPRLAPTQVVIIPIFKSDEEKQAVLETARQIEKTLVRAGHSVFVDDRDQYKPGWKFNEYEMLGVPVRIEIGPRDLAQGLCTIARRDTGEKQALALDRVATEVPTLLETIQTSMLERARVRLQSKIFTVNDYAGLLDIVTNEKGFARAHWCGSADCETKVKDETKATIRCIPFDEPAEKGACAVCGGSSERRVLFSKAY